MAVQDDYDGSTFEYEGETYPFDPARLMGSQVKLMQSRTGYTYDQYIEGCSTADAEAIGFYLWMTLGQPGKYSEFDYDYFALVTSVKEGQKQEGDDEKPDPTPPPNRAARRSKKGSAATAPSSPSTAVSAPTGS